MAHRKQGYRFKEDWEKEYLSENLKGWTQAVTIPVNQEIRAEHRVLNFDRIKEMVENAEVIAHMDCVCRVSRGYCDAPINNCLSINKRAEKALNTDAFKSRNPVRVSPEEAIAVLRASNRAGLVHMAYAVNDQEINELCSCCSCCCIALSAVLRYGLYPHLLTAEMVEETDYGKCISCGLCVERCHFGARKITSEGLKVDSALCYGCGLCLESCPSSAIKLNPL